MNHACKQTNHYVFIKFISLINENKEFIYVTHLPSGNPGLGQLCSALKSAILIWEHLEMKCFVSVTYL